MLITTRRCFAGATPGAGTSSSRRAQTRSDSTTPGGRASDCCRQSRWDQSRAWVVSGTLDLSQSSWVVHQTYISLTHVSAPRRGLVCAGRGSVPGWATAGLQQLVWQPPLCGHRWGEGGHAPVQGRYLPTCPFFLLVTSGVLVPVIWFDVRWWPLGWLRQSALQPAAGAGGAGTVLCVQRQVQRRQQARQSPNTQHPAADFLFREILGGANDGCLYVYDRGANKQTSRIEAHRDDVNAVTTSLSQCQVYWNFIPR